MDRLRFLFGSAVGALGTRLEHAADTFVSAVVGELRGAGEDVTPGARTAEIAWNSVPDAEQYEIRVDGQRLVTVNRNTFKYRVAVTSKTIVEVIDIPRRSLIQAVDVTQERQ